MIAKTKECLCKKYELSIDVALIRKSSDDLVLNVVKTGCHSKRPSARISNDPDKQLYF